MEGPMPDPASLDAEGDDDVPLNVVQEKAKLDRASSQRASSTSNQPGPQVSKPTPSVDLFGDVPTPPARPSTTDPPSTRPPPPKATATPPKQQKPGDSLLGLDFFGGPPSAASDRPSSATSTPGASAVSSRPDLKQSILSLYSSAPRTQSQNQSQDGFGGMQSPPAQQPSGFGGLDDAFSGLSFSSSTSPPLTQTQPQPKADPFASFTKPTPQRSSLVSPPIHSPPPPSGGGGGFFETGTRPATTSLNSKQPQASPVLQMPSSTNGLGDFNFATSSAPPAKAANTNASQDLSFSNPKPSPQVEAPSKPSEPSSSVNSVFNLSAPSQPPTKSTPLAPVSSTAFSGFSNEDAWGSNDAWASPEPSAASKPDINDKSKTTQIKSSGFSSWGGPNASSGFGSGGGTRGPPKITPDEDFGGWNTAAPEPSAPVTSNPPQPQAHSKPASGGFGTSEDLFSNVWQ
ncbi:MAG: hypothetical protein Q9167_004209 [Letrouitia subvulpina]